MGQPPCKISGRYLFNEQQPGQLVVVAEKSTMAAHVSGSRRRVTLFCSAGAAKRRSVHVVVRVRVLIRLKSAATASSLTVAQRVRASLSPVTSASKESRFSTTLRSSDSNVLLSSNGTCFVHSALPSGVNDPQYNPTRAGSRRTSREAAPHGVPHKEGALGTLLQTLPQARQQQ